MEKANCYECVHRGEIPGDAHSRCIDVELSEDGRSGSIWVGGFRKVGEFTVTDNEAKAREFAAAV